MDKRKINFVAPVLVVLFLAGNSSFAQQESEGEIAPPAKGYTYNFQDLIKKANENIRKVDKELQKQAREESNKKKEAVAREHFEKGDVLYKEGKLQEAQREWRKALDIAKSPDLQEYIKSSAKKAEEKELLNQKEEKERQARVKEEQARIDKERKDNERKQKEEQARIDKESKDKERQAKLEAEKQDKARLQAEEQARKAKEAAERESQKQLEAQKKEQVRIDKENKEKEAAEKGKQQSGKNFN